MIERTNGPPGESPVGRTKGTHEDAERRQLTVLFCDLVGSSGLSERMDPEDLRDLIGRFQTACANEVRALEGYVAQYLGDGLLVYFGFPSAREDDAQRAVQCGFRIMEALARLNAQGSVEPGSNLSVRIGIDTGVVVVGQMSNDRGNEPLALGETPNLAARFQSIAEPNSILIGERTHRLVQGWFACEALKQSPLKGFSRPIQVFRVIGPKPVHSRMEVGLQEGLSPFVGRDRELRLLLDAWSQAREGRGSSVLMEGEPGIGKSRLAQELKISVLGGGASVLTMACSADHQSSPFSPVLDAISRSLSFAPGDTSEERLTKFEQGAASHLRASPDVFALMAQLLSVPGGRHHEPTMSAPLRRRRSQEVLADWLLEESLSRPLLIVWEDLHWIDPSSLELLGILMSRVRDQRVLLLLNTRPGFEIGHADVAPVHITVNKLDREVAGELVRHIAGQQRIPDSVASQLLEKGDGVPLFIEELTKAIIEQTPTPSPQRSAPMLPSTLQSLLMSRFDRLPYGKEVARLAATIGREFSAELLRIIWPLGQDFLDKGLGELSAARLILQKGDEPNVWAFKHALIRDVSYESILHRSRRQYHGRIATALQESRPDKVATEPEILAHHYAQADLNEEAAHFWYLAGRLAIERSASIEAIDHLNRGLALLDGLPETPACVEQKLVFLLALGGPLLALRGYASPEVGALFTRAGNLCSDTADESRLFDVLQGLHSHHVVRGELDVALTLSRRLHELAQRLGNETRVLEAQLRLAISLYPLARLEEARVILETQMMPFATKQRNSESYLFGQDPYVSCLCHLSVVLWLQGRPDDSLRWAAEAREAAEDLKHGFTLSWALLYGAMVHGCCGDVAGALVHAEGLIALCTEQGFSYRLAQGRILSGWARVRTGDKDGLKQITAAIAAVRATGALIFTPYYFALLADACLAVGDSRQGLAALAEATAIVAITKESFCVAELHRLEAELVLLQGPEAMPQAETLLRTALAEARDQTAWSLALRTSVSLARLLIRQGRSPEAKELLTFARAGVKGEGTIDARQADELLRGLG